MSFLWPNLGTHGLSLLPKHYQQGPVTQWEACRNRRTVSTTHPSNHHARTNLTLISMFSTVYKSQQYAFQMTTTKTDNSYFLKPSLSCPSVSQSEWRATRSDKLPVTSPAEQRGLNIQQLISEQETAPGHLKGNPAITAPTLCTPHRTPSRWPAVYQLLWLSDLNIFIFFNGFHYLLLSF